MLHLWNYAAWFRMYINFFCSYCELNSYNFINSLGAIYTGILYSSFNNDFPSMIRCVNTIDQICTYDTWSVLNCQFSKHFLISFNMQAFMSLIDCLANKVPYTIRKTFYIWSSYYANPGQNNCQKMTCLLAVRHNVDFKHLAIII